MVPVDNPRFAMVVVVNDPDPTRKGYYGGVVAGPVFRNVMEGALRLMDVPPDDIDAWLAVQAAAEAKRMKAEASAAAGACRRRRRAIRRRQREGTAMTRAMLLGELLPELEGLSADLAITGLVQDSREVQPGDAFVAIAGFGAHGLNFVDVAREAGAAAVLLNRRRRTTCPRPPTRSRSSGLRAAHGHDGRPFHGHPSAAMATVGVTGTNGKTSTVQLLAQAWTLRGQRAGTDRHAGRGAVRRRSCRPVSPPRWCCACTRCWPSCATRAHRRWRWKCPRTRSTRAAWTACTSTWRCSPTSPATTSTTTATWPRYGAAKARLFDWPGLRAAVVNLDDAFGRELFAAVGGRRARAGLQLARRRRCQRARGRRWCWTAAASRFDLLHAGGQAHPVRSPLLGRFNVDNLLARGGRAARDGHGAGAIAETLSQLQPVDGRMNRLGGEAGAPLVVVDYAHTPDALEQALASLRAHTAGR